MGKLVLLTYPLELSITHSHQAVISPIKIFSLFRRVLEFVNSAVDAYSNMIGCFEFVSLSPPLLLFK